MFIVNMKSFLILLVVCACVAANPPTERVQKASEADPMPICALWTPCHWSVYNKRTRNVELNITNISCQCGENTPCQPNEYDVLQACITYRCKPLE